MFSRPSWFRSTTFRLTLWNVVLYGILSFAAFTIAYGSLGAYLRQQIDLELLEEAEECKVIGQDNGTERLAAEFNRESQTIGPKKVFYRLLSPDGRLRFSSDMDSWRNLELDALPKPDAQPLLSTLHPANRKYGVRMVSQRIMDRQILQIGTTLRPYGRFMKRCQGIFSWTLAAMLGLGVPLAWLLAHRAMAGVNRVTWTAARIGRGDLSRRVPVGSEGQEIQALVEAFNDMLERIGVLVRELKEITDNVAHDLRTPITRIRGIAETTLTGVGGIEAYREMAAEVIEESDRLVNMVNATLEIAQADTGLARLKSETVDLCEIAREAKDLFEPVALDKNIDLVVETPACSVTVMADRTKVQRAVANLLDNALKYTPSAGKVELVVGTDKDQAHIKFTDSGVGVEPADLTRIFERFYRADKSRSTSGSGLGLSLARALIRAHGGDITVTSQPGKGSTFEIVLPLRPEHDETVISGSSPRNPH